MTAVSIIGNGNMGKAIAKLFERADVEATFIAHSDVADAEYGDIVILAVPYGALDDIVEKAAGKLDGKTVVDITNPVDFSTGEPLAVEEGSAAAKLQRALPTSRVIKAFNTNFAATIAEGSVKDNPIRVLIAGEDEKAKKQFSDLIASSGAVAVDAGPLSRAHELEALGFLQISLAMREQIAWSDAGFVLFR